MTPPEIVALIVGVGVPVASALIAVGAYFGKRDERDKAGGPTVVHTESTTTVPAPAPPPLPTLSGLDDAALRGRLRGLEQRVDRLYQERDAHAAERAREVDAAIARKLKDAIHDLAGELRNTSSTSTKPEGKARIDDRRER